MKINHKIRTIGMYYTNFTTQHNFYTFNLVLAWCERFRALLCSIVFQQENKELRCDS